MSWQLRRRGIIYFLNDIEKFLSIHTEIMFIKAVLWFFQRPENQEENHIWFLNFKEGFSMQINFSCQNISV